MLNKDPLGLENIKFEKDPLGLATSEERSKKITASPIIENILHSAGSASIGTLQDALNLILGAMNLPASAIESSETPKFPFLPKSTPSALPFLAPAKSALSTRVPVPDISQYARSPVFEKVGEFIDPLAYVIPGGTAMKALPKTTVLKRLAPSLATGALFGGIYGAGEPDKNLYTQAGLGAAGAGAMHGISSQLLKLLPLNKQLYPHMQKATNDIINELKGPADINADRKAFDTISRFYDELYGHKDFDIYGRPINSANNVFIAPENSVSSAYDKVLDEIAAKGINIDRSNFDKTIDDIIQDAEKGLDQYKNNPQFRKKYEDIINLLQGIKNTDIKNHTQIDRLKRDLNQEIGELEPSNETRNILTKINKALQKTIENTSTKDDMAYTLWKNADKRYQDEIIPFKKSKTGSDSPFIKIYQNKGANTDDFLKSYIKPGKDDLTKQFFKMVPNNDIRDLAAYDYFKTAIDDPAKFMQKYKQLSSDQKQLLVPDYKDILDKFSNLYKKTEVPFTKPKEYSSWLKFLSGVGGLGTHSLGMPGLTATLVAPAAAEIAAKGITLSPAARKQIIEQALPSTISRYLTPAITKGIFSFEGK